MSEQDPHSNRPSGFQVFLGIVKDWGLALLITVVVIGTWQALVRPNPVSNGPAPAFSVPDLQGTAVSLDQMEEQVLVLNFWATWCGPCRSEIPEFAAFHLENPDVGMYGVSVDIGMDPRRLGLISVQLGINYPVLHDNSGRTAQAWSVRGYPTTYVLDAHRHVVASHQGPLTRRGLDGLVAKAKAAHSGT